MDIRKETWHFDKKLHEEGWVRYKSKEGVKIDIYIEGEKIPKVINPNGVEY